MENQIQRILLVGNPNCGKTSLFNLLAGLNQKVSNIPGTTVEKVTGKLTIEGQGYELIDLPGAYSLIPKSEDEMVATQELLKAQNAIIVFVADSTRLESNLFYFSQVADLGLPTLLVLNMFDLAHRKGVEIDTNLLSEKLGVLVLTTSAVRGEGISKLKTTIGKVNTATQTIFHETNTNSVPEKISDYRTFVSNQVESFSKGESLELEGRKQDAVVRQNKLSDILGVAVKKQSKLSGKIEKLDKLFLHPFWGMFIMFAILFVIFQSVFTLAELPMQGIEWLFVEAGNLFNNILPSGMFRDILVQGVIPGLAGIVVFLPQILILFFFIGIMEETGYITRVSFLSDRFMRRFGLNGKSVIPMAGGLACAIPSIMAARSIENKAEKLATILITPLMTCSARLPVYTLLISLMISEDSSVGIFNTRGLVLMGMYLLGFVSALVFSLIFRLFIKAEVHNFFMLELPELKAPRWKALFVTLFRKGMTFLTGAGKVILIVSLLLFFLKTNGPGDSLEKIETQFEQQYSQELNPEQGLEKEAALLEASWIGRIGHVIEPVIKPLGYDWKIGIALITSFAAREVFVGTMSAIYGVAEDEDKGLRERLQDQKDASGNPVYTFPVLVSLLIFYAFALQCMSTIAVVYKETNSIKWPTVQLLSMTGAAYLLSMLAYSILS